MRSVLLICALASSWLAAPRIDVSAGDREDRVAGTPHDAVLVARLRASDRIRAPEIRPQRFSLGAHQALHLFASAASVRVAAGAATGALARPADLANALSVIARPRQPRAPPLALG